MDGYDSTKDTMKHIKYVKNYLEMFCEVIKERAYTHDDTKLGFPEKEIFDEYTPKLKATTYNSDEYKRYLKEMNVALAHHYKHNSHHPEHYQNGIDDFDLFDLVEMFIDWKAASERHENGNIYSSIEKNKIRFNMSEQLSRILTNTAKKYGWEK